jgi:hypothetical protein
MADGRHRVRITLIWLATAAALLPFPFLGLLTFPALPILGIVCAIRILRLEDLQVATGWQVYIGALLVVIGTAVLCAGAVLTPLGFLLAVGNGSKIGFYHFTIPVHRLVGVPAIGPFQGLAIPVFWAASGGLLAFGTAMRSQWSWRIATEMFGYAIATCVLSALIFGVLSMLWPLGV